VRVRNHSEYVGIYIYIWEDNSRNGRGGGSVYRIDLPQDRGTWLAIVKTVLNFGFHKMRGIP